jgi:hypothetical protein
MVDDSNARQIHRPGYFRLAKPGLEVGEEIVQKRDSPLQAGGLDLLFGDSGKLPSRRGNGIVE